jgi:hypothetical protein
MYRAVFRVAVKLPPQGILVGSEPLLKHLIVNFANAFGLQSCTD